MSKALQTLSDDECKKLLDVLLTPRHEPRPNLASIRNYTMGVIMLDAGLRVGELVKLQIADLWYHGNPVQQLIVRSDIAKNHKSRLIPLTARLTSAIVSNANSLWRVGIDMPHCPAFSQGSARMPLSTRQVQRIICRAANLSIGRCVHPHILRHTFATRLMQKTNIRVVQELLGHSSLSSTQIYTHPNNQDLKKAIEGLE